MTDDFLLFAGSASKKLGAAIGEYLECPLGECETIRFSEGNLFVRVLENVRGRHTFLVQGTAFPANDNFMELLFWIDALKRASAESVTAVIPYFSYAKGDKKDEPRVSIRARVCADAIEAAGVDRVVTMDLHAPQLQGFFHVPVDDLYAMPMLCDAIAAKAFPDLVVVAPDAGFAKQARAYAKRLGVPYAIADKERTDHSETAHMLDLIGDVDGKTALIVDDFTITAGSLVDAAAHRQRPRCRADLRDGEPRPAHGDGGRAAGRQPDRAAVHHRHRRDPTRRRSPTRSRSSRSPRSSARRSAASTAARASASSSSRGAADWARA